MNLKPEHKQVALDVLTYLVPRQGTWTMLWNLGLLQFDDVSKAMPSIWSDTRRLAMMRVLFRNELVGGCDCGCRGDFEITDKGLALVGAQRTKPYLG